MMVRDIFRGFKILVVLDEASGLMELGQALSEALSSEIILSPVADEALDIVRKENITLLVADLDHEELAGGRVHQEMMKNRDNVPALFLSSSDELCKLQALTQNPHMRFIKKPCDPAEAAEQVAVMLKRYADSQRRENDFQEFAAHSILRIKKRRDGPPLSVGDTHAGKPRVTVTRKKPPVIAVRKKDPIKLIDKRYRVDYMINEGGHGTLYRAVDQLLDMPVAIKVLSERFLSDEEALADLRKEARIAIQLSHKHIIRLHNIQQSRDIFYLVMEYINGFTLSEYLTNLGAMEWSAVLRVVFICADALSYAHRRGIYHRDLKPSNLMLTEDGVLKIIDFGMACLAMTDRKNEYIMGTPYYISPEEVRGRPIDQRADVFSLGVTVHELMTGHLPLPPGDIKPDVLTYRPRIDERLPETLRAVLILSLIHI